MGVYACGMLPRINSCDKFNRNDFQGRVVVTAVTPEGENYEANVVSILSSS